MIHVITVPMEWFSWYVVLSYAYSAVPAVIGLVIAAYYAVLGVKDSLIASLAMVTLGLLASSSPHYMTVYIGVPFAIVLQSIAWFVQVQVGHFIFEQNKPGMLTKLTINSIVLSLLLAWDRHGLSLD
jgi:uncharacterized membrane protein YGL010W